MPTTLPAAVAQMLDRLKAALTAAAGDNLAGLVLYGGLARGRYRPGRSDVNLVVLLHELSAKSLDAIAPVLHEAWRSDAVEPMLMTPVEVPRIAQVFPVKFLDIKSRHIVLAGVDPFADLEVSAEHVRLRIEQELRNMLLRLRRSYVSAANDEAALRRTLEGVARPLAIELAALLRWSGVPLPDEDRTAAIFAAAAKALALDGEALARLATLRENPRGGDGEAALYTRLLATIERAAQRLQPGAGP